MSRIFLALALFAMLLLIANLITGLALGDFGKASRDYRAAWHNSEELARTDAPPAALEAAQLTRQLQMRALQQQRQHFWPHIWLGIGAALVTLLVNSISITYFIGTNRWSREVVEVFNLTPALAARSQKLKRQTFPWSLLAILLILTLSALGAAADPATLNPNACAWVEYHWGLAMLGVVVIAVCFFKQVLAVGSNYELISEIMDAADAERQRRRQVHETESVSTSGLPAPTDS